MGQGVDERSRVRTVQIDAGDEGQRIDNYLVRVLKGVPRSRIYRILRKGEVRVNRGRVAASYRLRRGDSVRLPPVRVAERPAPGRPGDTVLRALSRAVVYEDARLLVLDKPAGLAVHGGSGVAFGVIEGLRALRPEEPGLELVHRLDRDTSGCLVIARRRSALRTLHQLFREGRVDKRYLALLAGRWERDRAEVDLALRKNTLRSGERVVRPDAQGKPALTRFRVLRRLARATLVEAKLETGRTHQIRVHAAALGTPILGDDKYGEIRANRAAREAGLKRLFLHAASLRLRWPGDEQDLAVEAPLSNELQAFIEEIDRP
ncbi:MAG: RluA family pseudouridine synthase [Chromatiales bacterium]|jgi:23S rRNA pseudouridine955/2504/2580 synthase